MIDTGLDIVARQDPPNAGTLNTVLPLGGDAGDVLGFDISLRQILLVTAAGGTGQSLLVDFTSGGARVVGPIGNGEIVRGLAISLGQ